MIFPYRATIGSGKLVRESLERVNLHRLEICGAPHYCGERKTLNASIEFATRGMVRCLLTGGFLLHYYGFDSEKRSGAHLRIRVDRWLFGLVVLELRNRYKGLTMPRGSTDETKFIWSHLGLKLFGKKLFLFLWTVNFFRV